MESKLSEFLARTLLFINTEQPLKSSLDSEIPKTKAKLALGLIGTTLEYVYRGLKREPRLFCQPDDSCTRESTNLHISRQSSSRITCISLSISFNSFFAQKLLNPSTNRWLFVLSSSSSTAAKQSR